TSSYIRKYNYVGIVKEKISENSYLIEVKNKIKRGETIEIIRSKGEKISILLSEIINYENNDIIEEANPNQKIILEVDSSIQSGDLIRSLKTNATAN
ncbi:MAG: U32 family peptidase C-terminal domain-containing protein, partial [Defluviitoga tunisiensis]